MEDSRTLLTETGEDNPEKKSYSVIANRLVAYGGNEAARIETIVMDEHYLIVSKDPLHNFAVTPLSIVDKSEPSGALNAMYKQAMSIAESRAKFDKNRVLDLTSRAKSLPREAQYYALPSCDLRR